VFFLSFLSVAVVIYLQGMLQLNYCRVVICSSLYPRVLILFFSIPFFLTLRGEVYYTCCNCITVCAVISDHSTFCIDICDFFKIAAVVIYLFGGMLQLNYCRVVICSSLHQRVLIFIFSPIHVC
jgi:hypothetical protein